MNCEVKAENHKVLQMLEKFRGKLEQNVRKNEYNRDKILTVRIKAKKSYICSTGAMSLRGVVQIHGIELNKLQILNGMKDIAQNRVVQIDFSQNSSGAFAPLDQA